MKNYGLTKSAASPQLHVGKWRVKMLFISARRTNATPEEVAFANPCWSLASQL
jgi:hypothetical protein